MKTKQEKIETVLSAMSDKPNPQRGIVIISRTTLGSTEKPFVVDVVAESGTALTRAEKRPYFTDEEWVSYLKDQDPDAPFSVKGRFTKEQAAVLMKDIETGQKRGYKPKDGFNFLGLTPEQYAEMMTADPE